MPKFTFLSVTTVAILSMAPAPAALAQAANAEPGYCAQFYPNADCNSVGPGTPASNKEPGEAMENDAAEAAPVSPPAKPKKQAHRSASTTGTKTPKADAVPR